MPKPKKTDAAELGSPENPMTEQQAIDAGVDVEKVKAEAEVLTDSPAETPKVAEGELPPEYVEAGNTEYSGTSEMGKDVGRGYDNSEDKDK